MKEMILLLILFGVSIEVATDLKILNSVQQNLKVMKE